MLIKSEDTMMAADDMRMFDDFSNIDATDLFPTASFPSDDIWKKFEYDMDFIQPVTDPLLDDYLDRVLEWSLDALQEQDNKQDVNRIWNHDCMWAGHCGSKEHKPDLIKKQLPSFIPQPIPISIPMIQTPTTPITTTTTLNSNNNNTNQKRPLMSPSSRSLLLTSRNIPRSPVMQTTSAALGNCGPRPDSPPNSDEDDPPRIKQECLSFDNSLENRTLQLLKDAISECDLEEDSDLCDYLEDSDVFAEPETAREPPPRAIVYPVETDHSYHKGKGTMFRTDHLGVQTPSDSEEEIDVVSVGDKQLVTNLRNCGTVLPTNPSMRDRQKLQRTVASAISCKREYNNNNNNNNSHHLINVNGNGGGIKTRLPLRLPNNTVSHNTVLNERSGSIKKKPDGRRGVKRGRHRHPKSSPAISPAKRRLGYNHSSDSENDCSEKRNMHNNMERQRRVDLRNAFDDLRVLVPEVSSKERAAKVVILREAATYCHKLQNESSANTRHVNELRRHQERLRNRLSQLRKILAAKR